MKRLNGDEEERRALKDGGYKVPAEQKEGVQDKRERRRKQKEREAIESSL